MSLFPLPFFGQGAFQVDPNANPEEIERRREQLQSVTPKYGSARYVGEGLGHLAMGIAGGRLGRKLDKAESDGRARASEIFQRLLRGEPVGTAPTRGGPMTILGPRPMSSAPTNGPTVAAANEMELRKGLIDRGLPEHVADAFIMNFKDESGLNPGINEAAPVVPGSRGGYGLAQWTGPRRRALEAFAMSRGTDVADAGTQLDFLLHELQGSESAAARDILGAGSKGEAAAAIVNKFLRPAEEHRARREASYLQGGGGVDPTQSAPQHDIASLYSALSNPWLSEQQRAIVQAMIAQQQGAPMRDLEMQRAQLGLKQAALDYQQDKDGIPSGNGAFSQLEMQAKAAGLAPGTPEYQQFMLNGGGAPATFRALDLQARAAGFEPGMPEYAEFMATRGAGLAAGAKTTAENLADVATGGEAARVKAAGAERGKSEVARSDDLTEMERNMSSLMTVVDQLEGLADTATYTAAGQGIDWVRKQFGASPSDGAVARAEYIALVDNQVLPLLRQTFGAAFTAKEGDTLRATLGDPDKSPEEKKVVLRAFIEQKKRDLLSRGGTMPPAPTASGDEDDAAFLKRLGLE